MTYSYVQGGWPGAGNIDADPRFVDPDNGDYRLSLGSPCIDAGDSTAVPASVNEDLDGYPRLVDAVNYLDTGYGEGPMVDMGAYETEALTPAPLFAAHDILWRHTSGQTYVWLMDGTQLVDYGPPGSAGSTWQIAGAGDFDGDDHADILWRNTSSGQVFIWFMDGTQRVGAGSVGATPLAWQIAGTGDLPRERRGADRTRTHPLGSVHEPDEDLAARRVAPQDVGVIIAVEVAGAGDLPGRTGTSRWPIVDQLRAVHQPDIGLAAGVPPENVVGGEERRWRERLGLVGTHVDHGALAVARVEVIHGVHKTRVAVEILIDTRRHGGAVTGVDARRAE